MATYKVIQDIEAEDHILGPLTLRQFIYGLVTVLFGYLNFISVIKNVDFLLVIFLPPMLLAGFFAFPFKSDQPTEVWALARIRFMLKPRKRLWSQSGIKELVTITVPKKKVQQLTNGLSRSEVNDRLRSLAVVIDSRGWATKNATPFITEQLRSTAQQSDRLIDMSSIPSPVPDYNMTPDEDIFDEVNNPVAAQMNTRIEQSTKQHRQALIQSLNQIRGPVQTQAQSTLQPPLEPSKNERELSDALKSRTTLNSLALSNMHNLGERQNQAKTIPQTTPQQTLVSPINAESVPTDAPEPSFTTQLSPPQAVQTVSQNKSTANPAILNLAYNDDRSIESLAREANLSSSDGEVVINLH